MIFLDTNIFLRFYLRDDEAKAERCKNLLHAVASGRERAMTSTIWSWPRSFGCWNTPTNDLAGRWRTLY